MAHQMRIAPTQAVLISFLFIDGSNGVRPGKMTSRATNPNSVGRWENNVGNKGFYDVSRYMAANTDYNEWKKYAHDELALTLHMKVEAVKKVRLLESRGYEIVIED